MEEVIDHIEEEYGVVYQSIESYYTLLLLQQAGFSWKKAQLVHPDKDESLVEEKKQKLKSYWSRTAEKSPRAV